MTVKELIEWLGNMATPDMPVVITTGRDEQQAAFDDTDISIHTDKDGHVMVEIWVEG